MEQVDKQGVNKQEITDKEKEKQSRIAPILAYQWKKGQSGNIMGRPKGKTMKEYAREYLARMSDEERDEWLEGLDKEIIWKMSEGNPKQDTEVSVPEGLKISFDTTFNKDANTPQ